MCSVSNAKEDWKKAGIAIKKGGGSQSVVAHELARFAGGDTERMQVIQSVARSHQSKMGKAYEFPDSLRGMRSEYDEVTDDKLPAKMNTLANKKGNAAAADECRRLLAIADKIQPQVQACKDFANQGTKAEMLEELNKSRTSINRAVAGFSGKLKPEDDPKVLAEEGDRLMKLCSAYYGEQALLKAKLDHQGAGTVSERGDGRKLVKELENLHYRWRNDFWRMQANYAKRSLLSANRTPVVRLIFETNEDRDRARMLLKEALALVKHYSFNPALKSPS